MQIRSLRQVFLALVLPALASATVVRKLTWEELAVTSPVILRGVVVEQQVRRDDQENRIYTFTEVLVSEPLKGKTGTTVLVRQPGGEVDGLAHEVSGRAKFKRGEEVMLFLEPAADDDAVYLVRGMSFGKVRFEKAPTGDSRAVRDLEGLALYDDRAPDPKQAVQLQVVDKEDLGAADGFVARIRRAARGTAGGPR